MSIKLKAKTLLFQCLDKLPSRIGYQSYHLVQAKLGNISLSQKVDSSMDTFKDLRRIMKELDLSLEGKVVLEIGSGWLPIMPYFFKFEGHCSLVNTYDLNKHYKAKAIDRLNTFLNQKFKWNIQSSSENEYNLPHDIYYFPKTNLAEVDNLKAQFVFSRFVLEHVTPQDMEKMHRKFKETLEEGSYIIHYISPSDHRAYVDKELSLQDFLKYSEGEWKNIQTKFDYHNRYRLPQYLDLFKRLNFEIVHLEYEVPEENSSSYNKLKNLKIHEDFKLYTEEELMAGSIKIVLRT